MASFTGKSPSTWYGDIIQASNNGSGIDTSLRKLYDGKGNVTAIYLSDDALKVQANVDNSTGTFLVNNQGGSAILSVDTTNSKVLVNTGQVAATTQYAYFAVTHNDFGSVAANIHYPVPFIASASSGETDIDFGTGTDPDDSFTTANTDTQEAAQIVPMMWRIPDAITISSVTHIEGSELATGDTTRMHLKSFDFTSGSTSCLTNGTLLAHNSDVTNAGNEQAYLSTWTVDSANVGAGKVILAFFRQDSENSD